MNNLSWLMYFAGVAPNISSFLQATGMTGTIAIPLLVFMSFVGKDTTTNPKDGEDVKPLSWCWWFFLFIPLILISTIIPSKEVIYMIAASEMSEAAITSEYGQQLLGDLKDILDLQLAKLRD